MKLHLKVGLGLLSLLALSVPAAGPALAWGCIAVDSEGAYGYSYNYPDEEDAELRALNECDAKSNSNDCKTDSCDPNG